MTEKSNNQFACVVSQIAPPELYLRSKHKIRSLSDISIDASTHSS